MKSLTTNQVVTLASGLIRLTKEQAQARRHCLKECGEGVFEILSAVQFKAGETIGFDGQVPKGQVSYLDHVDAEDVDIEDLETVALIDRSVATILSALADLSDDDYIALAEAECMKEKPRKMLIKAFADEDARRNIVQE